MEEKELEIEEEMKEEGEEELAKEEEDKEEEQKEEEQKESKKFLKKKEKKDKKEEKIAELEDKVKRQMAEFENFRKRTEKEKSAMFEVGAKSVIEKILPIIDNFERGLLSVPEEEKGSSFSEGMQMIYKQLLTGLEEIGVKAIESVGQNFDPELHNAVMHIDDEQYGENEVVEEMQKGYMYHDSVVRHSMVKVAN